MPGLFIQVLPFTSAAAGLVGRTFNINALHAPKIQPGQSIPKNELIPILIELFTIAAISALAAEGGIEGGVFKGALIGTVAAALAYIIPKLYLRDTLDKHCKGCTAWGRVGLGVLCLLGLFVVLVVLNAVMLSKR